MRNMAVQTKGVLLSGFLLILTTIITTACGSTEPDHLSGGEPRGGQIPSETSAPEDSSSPAITTPTLSLREGSEGTSAPVLTPTPVPAPTSTPTSPAQPTTEVPVATTTAKTAVDIGEGSVPPDPDYERAFRDARLSSSGWDTDFRFHTVPYSEIKFIIPRDNIPSIDSPTFVSSTEASAWLKGVEPVVSLEIGGDARAYPLQILTWHEIVNDEVGGVPVAVTFCPLCNSAIAFDRLFDGVELDFGVSGNLRNSDLIMYDRQTHSWWQQFTGEGIVGKYAGRNLQQLPASIVSFADFRRAHPDGQVLSRNTGYTRQYGRNPYAGYDTADGNPFLFRGDLDGRLLPVERVVAVTIDDVDVAFPLTVLQEEGAINYSVGERRIAVFHRFGTASALDGGSIAESRDVGAAGVFNADLGGEALTFVAQDGVIKDQQTGSVWDILGRAVEGPLVGERLTPVLHGNHFWFAWAVFKPDTIVYQGRDGA